ncbi:transposase, Ptta/En/Spm, transposase, Tnp1/En/Spm-like protein, partial [Tanacetum coccineum]
MEYRKPGGVKLSVTFDALNRISGKHRALFSSFLGDMVREHIGLKILAWNKVGSEARDKLWDEITRYFDVDLTVRKLVMNRLGQLLRNFRTKLRRTYILPNQDTPSKLNEVPAKYTAILKAEEWVNFVKYTATQAYKVKSAAGKMARSKCLYPHTMGRGGYAHVKEQMYNNLFPILCVHKEIEDKIKEGTLKVDQGADNITVVLGKEKGGYARGVGSGVTYKSVDETSYCSISPQNDLGALLKRCKIIVWDKVPMANKLCFEALDHSLRDILRKNRYDTCQQTFGNMMMVFGSDYGQVHPVIPKGSRQDIVSTSLKEPYLWDHCNVLKLTANMRLTMGTRRKNRYDTCQQPFGNMMMVFGSDFGQVLPVIPKGSRQDIKKKEDVSLDEEDDGLKTILWEEVLNRAESWTYYDGELPLIALEVERLIFKDLVNEVVLGEASH